MNFLGDTRERRLSKRKPVEVYVYLSYSGGPVTRCVASNISKAGIFLKLNPLFVPKNQPIDLVFALRSGASNVLRLRRVPATVTRSESQGVGLRFCGKRRKTDRFRA